MKTSAFLRPVRSATGNTRLWIQSRLARLDARQVLLDSPALILAIAVLALPAISALQGNTTTADVSAEVNKTRSVAIGDINGDGFPDIAVANEDNERNRVYFGDGSGGISSSIDISSIHAETSDAIDLADVDQDGDLDVIIGNREAAQPNRLYTWEAANSRFDFRSTLLNDALYTRMTSDVRFALINSDDDPDVVVANRNAQNVVFFGSGIAGQFAFPDVDPLQDSAQSDSSSVAVGNLTEDNCPDLVVGNRRNVRNDLYINASDCSGFALRRDLSPDADYTDWIEIADINNDGKNDVLTANRFQRNKYLLGTGLAISPFEPSKAISPDADYTRDIRAVDVDGDGDLDIIAANAAPAPNKLYLNRLTESGILGFDAAIALPSGSYDAIAIAVCGPPDCDFDGDGDVDLVIGNNGPLGSDTGAVNKIVFDNNENPLFTSEPIEGATTGSPYTYEVTTFDPDRAQVLDIALTGLGWLTLVDNGDGTATLSGDPGVSPQSVSLTVTDEDGLSANQNFSIVVSASNQAPDISSGAPISVIQGTGLPEYDHVFTATDAESAGTALTFSAPTLPSWMALFDNGDGSANLTGAPVQGDVGDHAVLVRVTDPSGRVDEESFFVEVIDGNDRPLAVNDNIQTTNGATVTRLGPQAPDLDSASVLWNDTDADDDVLVASLFTQATVGTATVNSDGTFQYIHGGGGPGTDSFEYRVIDGNGGQIRAFVNIAIDVSADTEPPVITLLGDAVVTVTVGGAYTDAGATATDDVDGDLTADIDTVNPVDVNTIGSYTVTYNVSDAADNAAIEVTRTVNVVTNPDATVPVITRLGDAVVQVIVGGTYTDAGATALDDVDGDITANIVTVNPVDANTLGSYTVTYNVSDAADNAAIEVTRTVNVVTNPDATVPVITRLGDAVVQVIVGGTYTDAGATALDDVDGDITANIVTVNPVDANTLGSYTVTYNVSDAAGNPAIEVTRTVNVVAVADTTAPVITRLGSATVSLTVGTAYTDAGATALDDVDGDITANIVTTNPVNTAAAGTYTVRYNVSDAAGNAATEVTREVTVTNRAPPRNSGGGSAGVLELLGMILLAGMSRRRMRLTRRSI